MILKKSSFFSRENLLPRSPIELCRTAAGLVAVGVLAVYLTANYFLKRHEPQIAAKIKSYFSQDVAFTGLRYELPGTIVVDGFRWGMAPGQEPSLQVREVRAGVSCTDFIFRPEKSLRRLSFEQPKIRDQASFLKIVLEVHHILKKITPSDRGFAFRANRMEFPFTDKATGKPYAGNMRLDYFRGKMDVTGNIDTPSPISFRVQSMKRGEKFDLRFIEASSASLQAKLWGQWHLNDVELKGHVFVNQGRFGRHSAVDLDARFGAYADRLVMNSFGFLLDGVPVNLAGRWEFAMPQAVELNLAYTPRFMTVKKNQRLQKLTARFSGVRHMDHVLLDGNLDLEVAPLNILSTEVESMALRFERLQAGIADLDNIMFHLAQAEIALPGKDQTVTFADVRWSLARKEGQPHIVRYNLPFYDGAVNGFATLDYSVRPAVFTSSANIYDVALGNIGVFLYDFNRSQGRLQAAVDVNYVEGWQVNGYASLADGLLKGHAVLDWVSEYFDLPPVRSLAFEKLSSVFEYRHNGWKFDSIRLRSADVNLDGYVALSRDGLVDSNLSVYCPRGFLEGSQRLRPLVRRIDLERDPLQFDFRLTGYFDRVNVRWTPSDLKTEIVNIIPAFIQRKIETSLDSPI